MDILARRKDLASRMNDPANHSGILDNGLTWFTRKNWRPDNKVLVCLIIKTGSIYEKEGTYGIAHFIEHMLFNGTKSYEGEKLIEELQRLGVGFGHDLNAYTSLDHTVYHLEIERSKENIEKALHILAEFAFDARLEAAHIEKERPIILEEKRLRSGKGEKYTTLLLSSLFAKTPYERLVIGTDEDINGVQKSDFQEFYNTWYTPENMAIAVVGDIDTEEVEFTIQTLFDRVKEGATPKEDIILPNIKTEPDAQVLFFSHEETTNGSIQLFTTRKGLRGKITEEDRMDWMRYTVSEILSERCKAYMMDNDTSVVQIESDYMSEYTRAHDLYNAGCVYSPEAWEESAYFLATEMERMRRYGPTIEEVNRVANSLRSRMEQRIIERETTQHWTYLQKILTSFILEDEVGMPEEDLVLLEQYLANVSTNELTEVARDLLDFKKMVCIVEAPMTQKDLDLPQKIEAIFTHISHSEIAPPTSSMTVDISERFTEAPSVISKEPTGAPLNMEHVVLQSGVPCYIKHTEFQKDRFMIRILFEAGDIYRPREQQGLTEMLLKYMMDSGTQKRTTSQIVQILQEKNIHISLEEQGPSSVALSGSAKTEDVELLLELLHDIAFEPLWKEVGYKHAHQYMKVSIIDIEANPKSAFAEMHGRKVLSEHPSSFTPRLNFLDGWTTEVLHQYYAETFHAQNMHVVSVSSLSIDKVETLLSRYFSHIPHGIKTSYEHLKVPIGFETSTYQELFEFNEDKALVHLTMPGVHLLHSDQHLYALSSDIFSDRLRKTVRESMGNTYSISAYHNAYRCLRGGDLSIRFSTNPREVAPTLERIAQELEKFVSNGITQDELDRSLAPQRTHFEAQKKENGFWLQSIVDPWNHVPNTYIFDQFALTQTVTVQDINEHLKHLQTTPSVTSVLFPKKN